MKQVYYLVAATEAQGVKDARERGWQRMAKARFATPEKDDVRVVWRINDLIPLSGKTLMFKGSDYETGPEGEFEMRRWAGDETAPGEKSHFDRFVAEGHGEWIG